MLCYTIIAAVIITLGLMTLGAESGMSEIVVKPGAENVGDFFSPLCVSFGGRPTLPNEIILVMHECDSIAVWYDATTCRNFIESKLYRKVHMHKILHAEVYLLRYHLVASDRIALVCGVLKSHVREFLRNIFCEMFVI